MEHRLLLYFTTLIDQGSFTKAAEILHISQPSLSTAIKKLEAYMELTLLERTTRKISLTQEGETLYIEAKKLLNHFQHVTNEMTRLKTNGPLKLQIGLIESVKFWLPKVVSSFSKSHQDIRIKLVEVLGLNQVESALQNYQIHLAITNQHFENEEIATIPIYKEDLVAVLPFGHPLEHVKNLSIQHFENERFIICQEGFQTRQDILNEFRKSGISPDIFFEIERFETACSLVAEGLGITIVPENYIKASFTPLPFSVRPIENYNLSRTVYIAYMKKRYLPPVVQSFMKITKEFFTDSSLD